MIKSDVLLFAYYEWELNRNESTGSDARLPGEREYRSNVSWEHTKKEISALEIWHVLY